MQVRNEAAKALSLALSRVLSRALSSASSPSTPPPQVLPQSASPFPLKTVTKANFEASLAELRHHVRTSDFVAIDLEMTGVTSAPWRESFEFDRSDVGYLKVKDSADKFAVVQFGVCPFRWDPSKHSFIAYPHNFYIFPSQELLGFAPSYEFLCQTTSIDFLAKYQFDFNACIHEGISYLSREQESEALRRLNSIYEGAWCDIKDVRDIPLVSMADILFAERMKNKFSEWRDGLLQEQNGEHQNQGISKGSKQQLKVMFFKMRPALGLYGFTSHQLKLIQLVIRKHFKDLSYVCVHSEDSSLQHVVVYTDSKDELNSLMKEVKDEQHRAGQMKIQSAVGFRHVIDLLSSEQKLVVGHNCFLDIAHVYRKFIGPLPRTTEEFVSSVNKYFPHVIDTKILLNANYMLQERMKKSIKTLSSAFTLLCPDIAGLSKSSGPTSQSCVKVEVQVDDSRSSSWNPGGKHEAGYDAFMTGCVFAQLCCHIGVDFKLHLSSQQLALNEKLQQYINLLYLSWMNKDIIDLRTGDKGSISPGTYGLKKRYQKINFEDIVIMWGFLSNLRVSEVRECISKVFGPASILSVYRLDETAVFIQFSKTELVSDFLLLKDTLERSDGPISVLHPLAKLLEGGNTCAASYDVYKEICGSPFSELLFADQAKAIGIKWRTKLVQNKVVVEKGKHGNYCVESDVNTASEVLGKTRPTPIDDDLNDLPHGHLRSYETEDSICAAEVNR